MDRLLAEPALLPLARVYGREVVRVQARAVLDEVRQELAAPPAGDGAEPLASAAESLGERLAGRVAARVASRFGSPLARVLNATGVFVHTNLGRSPLPREVAHALPALLDAYCDLEIELATGRRSERNRRVGPLVAALTGAEDAVAVNNNAGALVLALATLAGGREVVVSRGELVEIGGSFRIPDIIAAAGAELREVGTTNRVRIGDYARAIGERTAVLLKVMPSNYRIVGFTAEVGAEELARLGRERGLPVVVDEGSGLLRPHPAPQLAGHPSFTELVAAGCDLVMGSGDKLLGGPQAGLLAGSRVLVERCRRHPLYRALRPDRTAYATLEAVLRHHLAGETMPLDRLWGDPTALRARLERLAERLAHGVGAAGAPGELATEVVAAEAFLGGGSAPERPIPGEALAVRPLGRESTEGDGGGEGLLCRLRTGSPPVVGYLREGRLLLDLRTVDPDDDGALADAVVRALGAPVPPGGAGRGE